LSDGSLEYYCQRERAQPFSIIKAFMLRGKSYGITLVGLFGLGI